MIVKPVLVPPNLKSILSKGVQINVFRISAVEWNQEKLVNQELFLQVNGLLDQNAHGYKLIEENLAIPSKRFITYAAWE